MSLYFSALSLEIRTTSKPALLTQCPCCSSSGIDVDQYQSHHGFREASASMPIINHLIWGDVASVRDRETAFGCIRQLRFYKGRYTPFVCPWQSASANPLLQGERWSSSRACQRDPGFLCEIAAPYPVDPGVMPPNETGAGISASPCLNVHRG